MVIVSVLTAFALIAAIVAVVLVVRSEPSSAGEVFLDAADQTGPDPFSTSVQVAPLPSTTVTTGPTTTAGSSTTVNSRVGSQPGLYGGTQNNASCDPEQMIAFLEANPAKAAAWVQALNGDPSLRWSGGNQVQVSQIRAFIKELTPLNLTVDTRVTNYGYSNGKPTARQVVLQRGTAVLVDAYGVPRAKCGCGNPLTKPVAVASGVKYTGAQWSGWSPSTVVVVEQTTVVITTFVIVNLNGGGYIDRPTGSTGDRDTTSTYGGGGTTSSTLPATTSTVPPVTDTLPPSTDTISPPTVPPATLPPTDFCAQFQALTLKWSGTSADTPAQQQELAADFAVLTAAAPADVSADMHVVNDWIQAAVASGDPDSYPDSGGAEAAFANVESYINNVCGISTD